jgi:hypothetical protein
MTYVTEGSVLGVSVLFIILGTSAVAARTIVQVKSSFLALDDWFSILAWVRIEDMSQDVGFVNILALFQVLVVGECSIMIAGATYSGRWKE